MSTATALRPYFQRRRATLYQGDVLDVLRQMPSESVHCAITSPPYWGLRDYGVEGQIGLEATPVAYVAKMVEVFGELRRVLRDDGTLWLNLGDSYAAQGGGKEPGKYAANTGNNAVCGEIARKPPAGLKPKDLIGIPWRVALALQADGWWLRSDIIWAKPNPMPESVTDRPTKSYEHVFLLSKAATYYYDQEAVREPSDVDSPFWRTHPQGQRIVSRTDRLNGDNEAAPNTWLKDLLPNSGRNCRDVWTIATQPYSEAHFATFPEALVEPCIKAGTSERGVCPVCGAPWRRVVEKTVNTNGTGRNHIAGGDKTVGVGWEGTPRATLTVETTGWQPTCTHDAEPVPAIVLDPFAGSATTLLVAQKLGRCGVGIELSREYADIAARRLSQEVLAW